MKLATGNTGFGLSDRGAPEIRVGFRSGVGISVVVFQQGRGTCVFVPVVTDLNCADQSWFQAG